MPLTNAMRNAKRDAYLEDIAYHKGIARKLLKEKESVENSALVHPLVEQKIAEYEDKLSKLSRFKKYDKDKHTKYVKEYRLDYDHKPVSPFKHSIPYPVSPDHMPYTIEDAVSGARKQVKNLLNNELTYIIAAHGRGAVSSDQRSSGYPEKIYSGQFFQGTLLELDNFNFGSIVPDHCQLVGKVGESHQQALVRILQDTIYGNHLIYSKCKIFDSTRGKYWFPNLIFAGGDFIATICRIDKKNNTSYFPLMPAKRKQIDLRSILKTIHDREGSDVPINVIFNNCMHYLEGQLVSDDISDQFNCRGNKFAYGINKSRRRRRRRPKKSRRRRRRRHHRRSKRN